MKKQILFLAFCLLTISIFAQIDTTINGGSSSQLDVIDTILKSVFTLLSSFGIAVPYQGIILVVVGFIYHMIVKSVMKKKHAVALTTAAQTGKVPEAKPGFFKRLFGKKQ